MYTHTSAGFKGLVGMAVVIAVLEVVMFGIVLPIVLGFVDALGIGWLWHESFFVVPALRYCHPLAEAHFMVASTNPQQRFIALSQGVLLVAVCLTLINIVLMYAFLLRVHFRGAVTAIIRIIVGATLISLTLYTVALAGSEGVAEEALLWFVVAAIAFLVGIPLLANGIRFFNPEQPAQAAR